MIFCAARVGSFSLPLILRAETLEPDNSDFSASSIHIQVCSIVQIISSFCAFVLIYLELTWGYSVGEVFIIGGPSWERVSEMVFCMHVIYWQVLSETMPRRKWGKQDWTEGEFDLNLNHGADAARDSEDPMKNCEPGMAFM